MYRSKEYRECYVMRAMSMSILCAARLIILARFIILLILLRILHLLNVYLSVLIFRLSNLVLVSRPLLRESSARGVTGPVHGDSLHRDFLFFRHPHVGVFNLALPVDVHELH